ncbi:MAG: hypothetical protein MUE41_07720 [Gemmatimonadaceae bacterium]|jgi:predicted CXXCH cytochrome family protein|nr:hypothetical protein [Gemmatimonadaceae bacterium]
MQGLLRQVSGRALQLVLGAVVLAGCTDEKIVFRDREVVGNVPTAAANFVGYSDNERRATVCGACHIGAQGLWAQTGHAKAFEGLPAADRTNAGCLACHTTNGRGNVGPNTQAGFVSTSGNDQARYRDVQCESCHGAGLSHASNPTTANRPQASARAGSASAEGCGQCHNSSFSPTFQEWQSSGHGAMRHWSATGPNTRAECQGCHTGQGALTMLGVDARSSYKEKGQVGTAPLQLTCAVCHDPHSNAIPGQLRTPITVADERNLCMQCHNRRGTPEVNSSRGVHAPEGPLLLGQAGWWPPSLQLPGGQDRINGTHGSSANPRMCAGCHVMKFSIRDSTGRVTLNATGHTFEALPCVNAQGAPTLRNDCQITARTFKSCVGSGCHGTEAATRTVFDVATLRIRTLNDQLKALLARVPPTEFNATDGRYTTAEGSRFNTSLGDRAGSVAHNPYLVEALLIGSINQVRRDYNLSISEDLDLRFTFMLPPGERAKRPTVAALGGGQ